MVTIYLKDGHTAVVPSAIRGEEETPSAHTPIATFTFVCYDVNDKEVGRFRVGEVVGYSTE